MGTRRILRHDGRRQAVRDDDPWLAHEIFTAALYLAAGTAAVAVTVLAFGWLMATAAGYP